MITPPKDMDSIVRVVSDFKMKLSDLIPLPWISTLRLYQGLEFEPTWKALPTHKLTHAVLIKRLKIDIDPKEALKVRSCFTSIGFLPLCRPGEFPIFEVSQRCFQAKMLHSGNSP